MTLLMVGEDSPAFHDFLGLNRREEALKDSNVVEIASTSRKDKEYDEVEGEASTRPASVNSGQIEVSSRTVEIAGSLPSMFPVSSESGHLSWTKGNLQHHGNNSGFYKAENDGTNGKKRDDSYTRGSLQDANQANAEALASRSMKVPRLEGQDARKTPGTEDFNLTMQPPRPSSKAPRLPHSLILRADVSNSKRWDSFGQASLRPAQSSYTGVYMEQIPGKCSRENTTLTSHVPFPPADEGSRTGLKGSSTANLINNGTATPPAWGPVCAAECPGSSKLWSHGTGTRYQTLATASRQLTVFYGGQAHVFDDVPPEKAEAIMALAGSSGSSWSTIFSYRPRGSLVSSASETSAAGLERERDKIISRGSAINGFSNLVLSSDIQIAQTIPRKTASGCNSIGNTNLPQGNPTHLSQRSNDIHAATERHDSIVIHGVANVDAAQKEVS